jgi:hypothetical protein
MSIKIIEEVVRIETASLRSPSPVTSIPGIWQHRRDAIAKQCVIVSE